VLAINILTSGSGQFFAGRAFFGVGADTSAILMEHFNVNYALTFAGGRQIICFAFGFLFRPAGAAGDAVPIWRLATFALATAAAALKLLVIRALDRACKASS